MNAAQTLSVGSLATYTSIKSGDVKVKIVGTGSDRFGSFLRLKVTAKGNASYPVGHLFVASASQYLAKR